jgi:anti-sigma factor RsiW
MSEGCAERGDQLAPYVDRELDPASADAFALHLAGCAACRAGLHDALQLVALEARASGRGCSRA